jgi:hypothetical protein
LALEIQMSFLRLITIAILGCVFAVAVHSQNAKLDPGFLGTWNLDVGKSDFGSQPKPKMGQVNWGEHGWSFALVLANGDIFTDAVETDQGCVYIADFPLTCEYEILTPRHVRLTMKHDQSVIRVGEIELLDDGTTRTTHHVTPPDGAPYVEKTIWVKKK